MTSNKKENGLTKVSHNPYFNRWFSAIQSRLRELKDFLSHNPYFNRWFSAIIISNDIYDILEGSQSLF